VNEIERMLWDSFIEMAKRDREIKTKYNVFRISQVEDDISPLTLDISHISGDDPIKYRAELHFVPQYPIEKYILDFYVGGNINLIPVNFDIEIDGKNYHEKTAEQASRDKRRDRSLLMAGINVIRFAGIDVYHYPEQVAEDSIITMLSYWEMLNSGFNDAKEIGKITGE
jgi:very-short-patch-repair endonuclease